MFGIVKKCTIEINDITKIEENSTANSITIGENSDGNEVEYYFGNFKNSNAYKLMRALWKGEKLGSDVLTANN